MQDRIAYQGITFDDVLLEPGYSDVVPRDVDVRTQLTRNVKINIPIVSSPMDTVTESELAIALAQEGGIGIIHKNLSTPLQTREVDKVKRSENGIITDPITLPPDETVGHARRIMEEHRVSGVPITVNGVLRGILTRRDLKFLTDNNQKIAEVMTKDDLVVAPENTPLEAAEQILTKNKVEKLLLVDDQFRLKGLITIKDIDKTQKYPNACKDARGRLKVGAAVGVHDYERAASLIAAGVDVLVVDSAHGHSRNVIETVREIKRRHPIDVIAGNVATAAGAKALADAGADAVKAGIGPGSICTTRIVSGVGVPQMSAIAETTGALKGSGVPVIADGGIRYSGDITKALAGGAHACMIGGLFAGLAESPGQTILYRGRSFKVYRGMGSLGAMMAGSADRYSQAGGKLTGGKLVPEGVEGRVPFKGHLHDFVFQLVGGLRAGMGYCGCKTLEDLRTTTRFIQVTAASVQESHPHDIAITQEAPNYSTGTTRLGTAAKLAVLAVLAGPPAADAQQPYRPAPAQAATFATPFPTRAAPGGYGKPGAQAPPDGGQTQGNRPPAPTRPAPQPAPDRGGSAGFGGGKVMYFHKAADALAPDGPPDAGAVAMAAATDPLPAVVPDVQPPQLGAVPTPALPAAVPDRPIPVPPVVSVPEFPVTPRAAVVPELPAPPAPAAIAPVFAQPDAQKKAEPEKVDPAPKPVDPPATGPAALKPLPPEVTQLPPREKIFLMYDDATLEKAIVRAVQEAIKKPGVTGLAFPPLPEVVPPGTTYVSKTGSYPPNRAVYEPGFVVHRRLHFEEKNAERAGWDLGIIQPFVSAAYFYKDVLLWPNSLGSGLEVGFWDTNAGKCLPGSPTPYFLYPPGLTVTGMLTEAGVLTGAGFLLHPVGGGNLAGPFIR